MSGPLRWTHTRMEQLERAARMGLRVVLLRRGTEYIVVAKRITSDGRREALIGMLPMTGEELRFELEEMEAFHVLS